jgi:hypothetical protein
MQENARKNVSEKGIGEEMKHVQKKIFEYLECFFLETSKFVTEE